MYFASYYAYCLASHATRLLKPLDIGLACSLQISYGKEVDSLTHFGNFPPLVVKGRTKTYSKDKILGPCQGSGLIPPNPRTVLTKLPTYLGLEE